MWCIAYRLEYKYQNYTFHFNKQFHLWLQKCSTRWNVDTVYSSQIYSYRFQIHEKAALGIFFQKDFIFLELVIPLRCPHLQGTYAFSWLWSRVPPRSARCFVAKFHSASVSSSTGPFFFTIFTYSLGAGSLVIPAGVGAPCPRHFGASEEMFLPYFWVWTHVLMTVTEISRHAETLEGTQTGQLVLTWAKPRAGFRQSKRQCSLCCSSYLSWMWFELSWKGRALLVCVSPLHLLWNRPAGMKCYCLWCLTTLWPREKFPVLCAWHVIIFPVRAVRAVSFHSLSQQMPVKYTLF